MAQLAQGRPQAAAEIWNWRDEGRPETASGPGPGRARLRGLIQAAVGAGVGATALYFGLRIPGYVILGIASFIALAALLSPLGLFRAIESAFVTLGTWVGRGLTWLLLPAIFYLFFLPFRALFRNGRRDSMRRYFEEESTSYWVPHDEGRSASDSRLRQF
ncbi:MAG: hypothetical protein QNK03_09695 [Myxococcota bacterium]|nr:hypothetical protein [Myxococcota bacterium]